MLQSEEWGVGFITKFLVFLRKRRDTVVEKVDLSKSWETSQSKKSTGLLSVCKHRALPQFVAGTLGDRTVCVTVTKDKALRWANEGPLPFKHRDGALSFFQSSAGCGTLERSWR